MVYFSDAEVLVQAFRQLACFASSTLKFFVRVTFMLVTMVILHGGVMGKTIFAHKEGNPQTPEAEQLPGAEQFEKDLTENLKRMKQQRGSDYKPRTKHLRPDGSAKYTNRLFLESSPYLLQHAHNPVNWYPWDDEAFATAKRLKRPILLSIGYSTCHWCHVMEEESFEDEEIAKVLNENYIVIKVDREERPDVDAIYMAAVQAMTGGGGWPMTVWLTPDRKPFYGGTYFPARDGDRGSRVGFLTLLKELKKIYDTQPDKISQQSQQLSDYISRSLNQRNTKGDSPSPTSKILHDAFAYYKSGYDPTYGGMARAPKFPSSLPIRFLLRYHRRTHSKYALEMATTTLKKMAAGGMYDHVAGGFHRYSTDEKWLVPHFEKMLYDNALLVMAYLEAYQVTSDTNFLRITKEILHYVQRDMTSPDGGFYSATDADSLTPKNQREEGYFFTWTPDELDKALGKDFSRIAKEHFGVTASGNFEGRNILHTPKDSKAIAKRLKITAKKLLMTITNIKETLYNVRNSRPHPIRDEKVLTAWNGLMISAFARTGLILDEKQFTDHAVRAAEFIKKNLHENGRLYRSYKDGMRKHNAYLDDYAFYIAAVLDLYESTHDISWLNLAIDLDKTLEKHYEDKSSGGFYMTTDDHETLLVREKSAFDGAEPSGNSVAILNLLRLLELTTEDTYRQRAEKAFKVFYESLTKSPAALSEMLLAVDFYLDKPKELVIITPNGKREGADLFMKEFRQTYLPNKVLVVLSEGDELNAHTKTVPLVGGKRAIKGITTAYVCEKGICKFPASDPKLFLKQIAETNMLAN